MRFQEILSTVRPRADEVFLDTSIQIARILSGPEIKSRTRATISGYESSVTSSVVRQEFKRRLMPEAQYLLNKLIEKGSYTAVMRHVMSVLATRDRKRDICLESLQIVFENETEQGLTDRAKSYMRSRLRIGMIEFENSVTRIIEDAACACSMYPVTQNKR